MILYVITLGDPPLQVEIVTCVQPGASCAGCSDTGDQGDTNTNLVCSNTYKVTSSLYTIYTYKVTTLGKPSFKKTHFLIDIRQ